MIELNFENESGEKVDVGIFERLVRRSYEVLEGRIREMIGEKKGLLNLILVDDEKIWGINREYRGKDKPTDVISFAYLESEVVGEEVVVGDIFISVDTAKVQAKEHKHSFERELEVLFVHGLLHCFGFDHNTDEEEEEMEGWAKRILG